MTRPSFTEYMKNKSDIITVELFQMANLPGFEYFSDYDREWMERTAKLAASKHHCEVFSKRKGYAYEDMLGYINKGSWGIFVTGAEKNILRMFKGDVHTKGTGSKITPLRRSLESDDKVNPGDIVKRWIK